MTDRGFFQRLPSLRFLCTEEEIADTVVRVESSSHPGSSYFTLLVLSTLIAAYGLVANSTATVIGAMIVAPLMGPILGLGLGMVRNDHKIFYKALWAELLGVLVVIATAAAVALSVGAENIDFTSSEIAGRTRPTLYDLAIGFSAGLAGAYCTVHPVLQASVAGVAIAVALVPPLAVTGITAVGAVFGLIPWSLAIGSFMLFLANFLTIEAASMLIFLLTGLGHWKEVLKRRRTVLFKLFLLLVTGIFLWQQLAQLYLERLGLGYSRGVLRQFLSQIPGASLDDLKVELKGKELNVLAVVGSRQEVGTPIVAQAEAAIVKTLQSRVPDIRVSLVVRTVQSTYVSARGLLFEPPKGAGMSEEQLRLQSIEAVLRKAIRLHPPSELESFRELRREEKVRFIKVTVVSAYPLEPRIVAQLEAQVKALSVAEPLLQGETLKLVVQTLVVRSATAEQDVEFTPPDTATEAEKAQAKLEFDFRRHLEELVSHESGARLLEAHVRVDPATPEGPRKVQLKATVQGREILSPTLVGEWESALEKLLTSGEQTFQVSLEIESRIGSTIQRSSLKEEEQNRQQLERVIRTLRPKVASIPGAYLSGVPELSRRTDQRLDIRATVVSPKPLSEATVKSWQTALQKSIAPGSRVTLVIENRLGQLLP